MRVVGDNIVVFENGEWTETVIDNEPYICINIMYVIDALNDLFKVEQRFDGQTQFAEELKQFLKMFFLVSDSAVCYPRNNPPDINVALSMWAMYKLPELQYMNNVFDCDDFARAFQEFVAEEFDANVAARFWGVLKMCFEGKCDSGGHAYNWFIQPLTIDVEQGELIAAIWLVEPQIAAYTKPGKDGSARIQLTNGFLEYDSYVILE